MDEHGSPLPDVDPAVLGRRLVDAGHLTQAQLAVIVRRQREVGVPLERLLVEGGYVPAHVVATALADEERALLRTEQGLVIRRTTLRPAPPPGAPDPPRPVLRLAVSSEPDTADDATLSSLRTQLEAAIGEAEELRRRLVEEASARVELQVLRARVEEQAASLAAAEELARTLEAPRTTDRRAYTDERHVLFVPAAGRYELLERRGPAPEVGAVVALSGGRRFRVLRVGPAPFPGDASACVYLEPLASGPAQAS